MSTVRIRYLTARPGLGVISCIDSKSYDHVSRCSHPAIPPYPRHDSNGLAFFVAPWFILPLRLQPRKCSCSLIAFSARERRAGVRPPWIVSTAKSCAALHCCLPGCRPRDIGFQTEEWKGNAPVRARATYMRSDGWVHRRGKAVEREGGDRPVPRRKMCSC